MGMKTTSIILAALILLSLVGFIFAKFGAIPKNEFCSETRVYRTNLGLYLCDLNQESDSDFTCRSRVAGWEGFFMIRDLTGEECRYAQPVAPFHPTLIFGK